MIIGGGIRFGWLAPLLMVGFAATFATATSSGKTAVEYGVIVGIGTLYGIVLARRFKAPEVVEGQRAPVKTAILVAIVFGVALGATAAIGVALGWTEPYWVPEPVLLLTLYVLIGKQERIREKTIGTTLGVIAVVPVAIVAPPALATTAIAGVRSSSRSRSTPRDTGSTTPCSRSRSFSRSPRQAMLVPRQPTAALRSSSAPAFS